MGGFGGGGTVLELFFEGCDLLINFVHGWRERERGLGEGVGERGEEVMGCRKEKKRMRERERGKGLGER